ncbi:MAG: SpoIID/LytB domain-containing protein [Flavobacteriales bacterium]|nr:SpoIID/LytB domain-containing protein [Flavobacteriales bacterium]
MRKLIVLLLVVVTLPAVGREICVNLYFDVKITTAFLKVEKGSYGIYQAGNEVVDVDHRSLMTVSIVKGFLEVKANGQRREMQGSFTIETELPNSVIRIRVDDDERLYRGSIRVQVRNGRLFLINVVELDDYVAGVVESEGGHHMHREYLKAQVLIARTYALKHLNSYDRLGYDLNDGVDHQAYKSMAYAKNAYLIYKAVLMTKGEVLVDDQGKFLTAAYHSNSGGQTCNSEDVWSSALPYLRSVPDTFSRGMPHYAWTAEIDRVEWTKYLKSVCPDLEPDSVYAYLDFEQRERWLRLPCADESMRMKDLRGHFGLNSAFFDVATKGNTVYLSGRGFGHGVGLSQEGAMKMAQNGMRYNEILLHYYRGARIEELSNLMF